MLYHLSTSQLIRRWRMPRKDQLWLGYLADHSQILLTSMLNSQTKCTLQGINISHLGKRKIIFKMPFLGDMLVPWRVILPLKFYIFKGKDRLPTPHFSGSMLNVGGVMLNFWRDSLGRLSVLGLCFYGTNILLHDVEIMIINQTYIYIIWFKKVVCPCRHNVLDWGCTTCALSGYRILGSWKFRHQCRGDNDTAVAQMAFMATRHDDCPEAEANDATNGLLLKAAKFAPENRPLLPPKNNESFEPTIDFEGFLLFVSGRVFGVGQQEPVNHLAFWTFRPTKTNRWGEKTWNSTAGY